jgi:hypothetical protein
MIEWLKVVKYNDLSGNTERGEGRGRGPGMGLGRGAGESFLLRAVDHAGTILQRARSLSLTLRQSLSV